MSNTYELDNPPSEPISAIAFSPCNNIIAVASWNRDVSIYNHSPGADTPFTFSGRRVQYRAPVLDLCWSEDSDKLYTAGTDWDVRMTNMAVEDDQENQRVLSTHSAPCNKVAVSTSHSILVSTSWDGTMHVHKIGSYNFIRVRLAAKPFALSLSEDKAVVAMAERKVSVYNLSALKMLTEQAGSTANGVGPNEEENVLDVAPWQQRESSLKFMTRAIACMPDGAGFAISSIEGRVGVEWFDPDEQSKTYAFKCHRQTSTLPADENGEEKEVDIVYPVNALAFHPVHGTFATGGGDGVISIWDAVSKRRVKQYPKLSASVPAIAFSPDGRFMAVGVSPGYEDGQEEELVEPGSVKIVVRELAENEAKAKAK